MTAKELKLLVEALRESELLESFLAEALDRVKRKNILLRDLIRNVKTIEDTH